MESEQGDFFHAGADGSLERNRENMEDKGEIPPGENIGTLSEQAVFLAGQKVEKNNGNLGVLSSQVLSLSLPEETKEFPTAESTADSIESEDDKNLPWRSASQEILIGNTISPNSPSLVSSNVVTIEDSNKNNSEPDFDDLDGNLVRRTAEIEEGHKKKGVRYLPTNLMQPFIQNLVGEAQSACELHQGSIITKKADAEQYPYERRGFIFDFLDCNPDNDMQPPLENLPCRSESGDSLLAMQGSDTSFFKSSRPNSMDYYSSLNWKRVGNTLTNSFRSRNDGGQLPQNSAEILTEHIHLQESDEDELPPEAQTEIPQDSLLFCTPPDETGVKAQKSIIPDYPDEDYDSDDVNNDSGDSEEELCSTSAFDFLRKGMKDSKDPTNALEHEVIGEYQPSDAFLFLEESNITVTEENQELGHIVQNRSPPDKLNFEYTANLPNISSFANFGLKLESFAINENRASAFLVSQDGMKFSPTITHLGAEAIEDIDNDFESYPIPESRPSIENLGFGLDIAFGNHPSIPKSSSAARDSFDYIPFCSESNISTGNQENVSSSQLESISTVGDPPTKETSLLGQKIPEELLSLNENSNRKPNQTVNSINSAEIKNSGFEFHSETENHSSVEKLPIGPCSCDDSSSITNFLSEENSPIEIPPPAANILIELVKTFENSPNSSHIHEKTSFVENPSSKNAPVANRTFITELWLKANASIENPSSIDLKPRISLEISPSILNFGMESDITLENFSREESLNEESNDPFSFIEPMSNDEEEESQSLWDKLLLESNSSGIPLENPPSVVDVSNSCVGSSVEQENRVQAAKSDCQQETFSSVTNFELETLSTLENRSPDANVPVTAGNSGTESQNSFDVQSSDVNFALESIVFAEKDPSTANFALESSIPYHPSCFDNCLASLIDDRKSCMDLIDFATSDEEPTDTKDSAAEKSEDEVSRVLGLSGRAKYLSYPVLPSRGQEASPKTGEEEPNAKISPPCDVAVNCVSKEADFFTKEAIRCAIESIWKPNLDMDNDNAHGEVSALNWGVSLSHKEWRENRYQVSSASSCSTACKNCTRERGIEVESSAEEGSNHNKDRDSSDLDSSSNSTSMEKKTFCDRVRAMVSNVTELFRKRRARKVKALETATHQTSSISK